MEKQQSNSKNKIITTIILALITLSLIMFNYGFTTSDIAEASEEAVNLLNNEIVITQKHEEDDVIMYYQVINQVLELTEDTMYRIYVNINGEEYVKEIKCVNGACSDNIGLANCQTLGSMGADVCWLIVDEELEKGAMIHFSNGCVWQFTEEDADQIESATQSTVLINTIGGIVINKATVHAITLASDPLLSFEIEPTSAKGIIGQITDSFTTFINGIGESIVNMFDSLFITDGELSTLALVALSMLGLGLATGLTTMLISKFTR